jgi:hypothetical protein
VKCAALFSSYPSWFTTEGIVLRNVFDQSSHMAMLEETDAYIRRLVDFLTRVEAATVEPDA